MATYRAIKSGVKRRLSEAIDGTCSAIVTDANSGDKDLDLGEDIEEEEFESDEYDSDDDDIPLDELRPLTARPNVRPRPINITTVNDRPNNEAQGPSNNNGMGVGDVDGTGPCSTGGNTGSSRSSDDGEAGQTHSRSPSPVPNIDNEDFSDSDDIPLAGVMQDVAGEIRPGRDINTNRSPQANNPVEFKWARTDSFTPKQIPCTATKKINSDNTRNSPYDYFTTYCDDAVFEFIERKPTDLRSSISLKQNWCHIQMPRTGNRLIMQK
ncbi:hypothetical protein HOLleu_28745 [Holothuria leucospilota]|uniref:Uncharacterized protein n=1 Tax=Holothuria leucospilota TaxID=206669 RepID=A0A9Q1GYN6_HOLLE|nr:hypothetical protein HOLleu_28745 [Holothuria leucospilota]